MKKSIIFSIPGGSRHKSVVILLIFSIISFSIPLIVFITLVSVGENAIMGLLVSAIICWLSGWYVLRLYLWNRFGQEVYIIERGSLKTYFDYKYYKDRYKEVNFEKISLKYIYDDFVCSSNEIVTSGDEINKSTSIMMFELDDEVVTSFIEIPVAEIIDLGKRIEELMHAGTKNIDLR